MEYIKPLSENITLTITNQFDALKDKFNLNYEDDFKAFSIWYTVGVLATLNAKIIKD